MSKHFVRLKNSDGKNVYTYVALNYKYLYEFEFYCFGSPSLPGQF
jgi:hypothetical protein